MTIPPWLNINPMDYLQAMEAGSRTGLQERQIGDSERENLMRNSLAQQEFTSRQQEQQQREQELIAQNRQRAEEFAAGQSLQRDKLLADTASTARYDDQRQQQNAAADALRAASLQQAGILGQARIASSDQFHQDETGNQAAALALRTQAQDAKVDPLDLETAKGLQTRLNQIGEYVSKNAAALQANPANARALIAERSKIQNQIEALRAKYQTPPAATALVPPTSGTGTSDLKLPASYTTPEGTFGMDGNPLGTPSTGTSDPLLQDNSLPKLKDSKSKAALANQLAQEHPDWSRERIIAEVNLQ
jgi:hypothetical protein